MSVPSGTHQVFYPLHSNYAPYARERHAVLQTLLPINMSFFAVIGKLLPISAENIAFLADIGKKNFTDRP